MLADVAERKRIRVGRWWRHASLEDIQGRLTTKIARQRPEEPECSQIRKHQRSLPREVVFLTCLNNSRDMCIDVNKGKN